MQLRSFRFLRLLFLAALLWSAALAPACSDDDGDDNLQTECQLNPQTCPDAISDATDDLGSDLPDVLDDTGVAGDDTSESDAASDVADDTLIADTGGDALDTFDGTDSSDPDIADDTDTSDAVDGADTSPSSLIATESYEHEVLYGWIVAGQPTEARLAEVIGDGAVIISLRTPGEDSFDEPAFVAALGGIFVRYPVNSADYNTPAFREALYDLYDLHLDAGDLVYIHCASSNRAGASWALYQGERQGVAAEDAVAMGVAAGLTSLESMVRTILGV